MATKKSNRSALIPAAGYLRKSTKGKKADGRERQEHSIDQQREEVEKLAKQHGYLIVRWYVDDGVSGWKRDAKRPEFYRMLNDAAKLRDFSAILCDDIDRFSRAKLREVRSDMTALVNSGVAILHTVAQDKYDLSNDDDLGADLKLTIDIWGAHQYSKKLSRRVAMARRNRASEGKKTGGRAPYGYRNEGKHSMVLDDADKVRIVQRIFDRFTKSFHSLSRIAGDLNAEGLKSPQGNRWSSQTIKLVLRNETYRGTFTYNKRKQGEFNQLNEKGDVVAVGSEPRQPWKVTEAGVIRKADQFPAIVTAEIFETAQKRLATLKDFGKPRTAQRVYPLTGVLVCNHCGSKLYGVLAKNQKVEYRCPATQRFGASVCGYHTIREDRILPFLIEQLRSELTKAHEKLLCPRVESVVTEESENEVEAVAKLESRLAALKARIDQGENNLLACKDRRLLARLTEKLEAMQAEADEVEQELAAARSSGTDWRNLRLDDIDLDELKRWWAWTQERIVCIPKGDGSVIPCELVALRELFHDLGAEVRLNWTSEERECGGKARKYHQLADGCTFKLGKKAGKISPGCVKLEPPSSITTISVRREKRGIAVSVPRQGSGSQPRC
jgi:DNA invertase Pin-like site-specific DNA recombinase